MCALMLARPPADQPPAMPGYGQAAVPASLGHCHVQHIIQGKIRVLGASLTERGCVLSV